MGIINKHANLYNSKGELIEEAPIRRKGPAMPPRSTKYSGSNLMMNSFQ